MTEAKAKFLSKLEKQRDKSWRKFAETDLATNPWGAVYKLASNKFKTQNTLQTFELNGEITTDNQTTLNYLINNLLPDDDVNNNNYEQQIANNDFHATKAGNETNVTILDSEIDNLIAQINNRKAPGHDLLKGAILKRIHPIMTPFISKIFNACWKLSYFPIIWKKVFSLYCQKILSCFRQTLKIIDQSPYSHLMEKC